MSQKDKNITIETITPPGIGDDLMGCFFQYDKSAGTYSFFEPGNDQPLKTGLHKGKHFDFELASAQGIKWHLHISRKSTSTDVHGKWKEKPPENGWEPEQSYQATSGGGAGMEDEANIAAATA